MSELPGDVDRVVALAVHPWFGPGSLTYSDLRIPLAELRDAAMAQLEFKAWEADNRSFPLPTPEPADLILARRAVVQSARPRGRGRPRRSDEAVRRVALEAIAIHSEGLPVIATLSQRRQVSPDTAKDWIEDARRRDYLEPTERGRRSFVAGPTLAGEDP